MGRGKLVFKGETKAKKKKGSTTKKKSGGGEHACAGVDVASVGVGVARTEDAAARAPSSHADSFARSSPEDQTPDTQGGAKIKSGTGTITTSGTVVSGIGTAFKTELRVGDAILARTQKGGEEMRVIKMVLSQVSVSISSAFSADLRTPTPFSYINKPRDDNKEKAMKAEKARQEKEEVEQRAMGTYGTKGEVAWRERTEHGSYRIRREQASTDMSRSDLLAVRAKKKSDRYC